ncbi:c-type cytochrome [Lutibacter sp.]|uniref:c-type cytochrome n=1 Tax=Lutibacter sp. TaxID=1925666 RepID=UPI0025B846F0|nr:c-type cytochrome [Lutibacter sp.]MCF6182528.1 c-type cytochrome [Lutibacter sp.]
MNTFSKQIIAIFTVIIALTSCKNTTQKKENNTQTKPIEATQTANNSEGYQLLKTTCYACHNPNTKNHDNIIAPPMIAVKKMYSMRYNTKDTFVNAIVSWASNPKEENSLMKGAVNRFKVMPKQGFKKEDLTKIATYIYENKIETPSWFAEHEKQMRSNGMMNMKSKN